MQSNNILNGLGKMAALAGVLLVSGITHAADVYLQTESYTKDLYNSDPVPALIESVPMWRFICDPAAVTNPDCTDPTSGSPQIGLAEGDSLTIHVNNTLLTPVSIVIPGQMEDLAGDAIFDGGRVRSFAHETLAGGSNTYTWSSLRAGTYLYQSGTHPSIQVPMGLYGALVVGGPATTVVCTTGQPAYDDADSCFDNEVVMLFSEVDPMQNAAVQLAGGTVSSYPSTVNYSPTYLLVNGDLSANFDGIGDTGGTTPEASAVLLRLLNAGSRSHTPAIVGLDMTLIAEDGNVYPGNPLIQAQTLLPAGKTIDAIVNAPADNQTFGLYDRTPTFTNTDLPQGGMIANIVANAGSPDSTALPLAIDDTYEVTEDGIHTTVVGDADPNLAGVLDNDDGTLGGATVVATTSNGTLSLNSDGSFTYTPNKDFSGTDGFTYSAAGGGNTYGASVTLNVSFINDAPVAAEDGPYINAVGDDVVVDLAHSVLGNDADPDGDTLTADLFVGTGCPDLGADLTFGTDGSFVYTGMAAANFCYQANDGNDGLSDPVSVELQYLAPSNITLSVVEPDGGMPVTSYRWIVQEDATYRIDPTDPGSTPFIDQQFLNFHKSTMPVIAQGCTDCDPEITPFSDVALDPNKHYYVSVLPNDATLRTDTPNPDDSVGIGHTMGGAQISPADILAGAVTVIVNKQEIPTAQISVLIFEDRAPTNGVPDPGELGLEAFQVVLEDAGGRYGVSGGAMSQDAFGAPLTNSLPCAPASTPGVILSCADGSVLIENLPPGKYGVIGIAPASGDTWTQTSTIEGTKVIDAWVKAAEPQFFLEFGGPGPHAFIGFVNPDRTCLGPSDPEQTCLVDPGTPAPSTSSFSGHVTLLHDPRPPGTPGTVDSDSYLGLSHTRAWVGLNTIAGDGPNISTVQADADGNFNFDGIPNGTYQVVVWDTYLNQVISFQTVTLPDDAGDIGNIPVPAWFTRAEHNVFLDTNGDGVRDPGEAPLAEQAVNLRWRDGTVNQAFPTDLDGFVPFDSIFPFFSWQVFEVDYTRFKATGVTVTVDGGGDVTTGPYPGLLQPQPQPDAGGALSRTETGPVLTQGFQGFPGQTSIMDWGKAPYEPGENGGISGIVFYGSTRGEADPRLTVGDPWEPGIAGVTVRLFREIERDPTEIDINVDPVEGFPGTGDTDWNANGMYDGPTTLKLIAETTTDSWDNSNPEGCPGELPGDPFTADTLGIENIERCYDGWRNWNQVRPATFDGGYAFGATEEDRLAPGVYVVEAVVPQGYELIKEQDMNVGFGDAFGPNANGFAPTPVTLPNGMLVLMVPDQAMIAAAQGPEPGIAQPPCVGLYQTVPDELSLFPDAAPFAGADRPLCDRKRVVLSDQGQAAAEFHLFTSTPVATQFTGLITDDLSNEVDPRSPGFGEKWSPAYLPFSIRDFKGQEVYRGYGDAFGRYNGLAPSTFTANIPIPSGYSPAMLAACLNDPGDGPDIDPLRLGNYSNSCYTMQFMPGTTTYLDTPILPTAAFAAGFNPVDCAAPARTPVIATVTGDGNIGPLVATTGQLTISSHGNTTIPNPAYEGPLDLVNLATIDRDLGFGGNPGTVTLDGNVLTGVTWSDTSITGTVPGLVDGSYQLVVTRDTGETSINTVTVTVGNETPIEVVDGGSIQAAIDVAPAGSLILVGPGLYREMVIMSKPLRLQGAGADTVINAIKNPTENLQDWLDKVAGLFGDGVTGAVDPLPGQLDFTLATEQGAGITVLAKNDGSWSAANPRIDGFTITGADVGGGIYVNGYAHSLQISNNNVTGNSGFRHGGIRIGQPSLPLVGSGPFAFNTGVNVHHNAITSNGALNFHSAGGGVSMSTGSDNYVVSENFICGNYTAGDGAGVGHLGLSNNGRIDHNTILFNQSFNLSFNQHGGGIVIAGEPGQPPGMTLGAGDVIIDANLIQGNQAASGNGGGIRAQLVNGLDVGPGNPGLWHELTITNNMLVNNIAGGAGAGISLQDTVNATIVLNTIANNDSTATVGTVLGTGGVSTPQPAGISSELNSLALNAAIPGGSANKAFSNPTLTHNIIWHNRAFLFDGSQLQPILDPVAVGDCVSGANFIDLGVVDQGPGLNPRRNLMTDTTGYHSSNVAGDPLLVDEYCNGGRSLTDPGPILATAAFAEGGNSVDVRYGPLTLAWSNADMTNAAPWDYHIGDVSPAIDFSDDDQQPSGGTMDHDFDDQPRPAGLRRDAGADEVSGTAPTVIASVTPTSLAFGNVIPGETANLDLTLSNAGSANLTGIAVGVFPPGFSELSSTCTATLAAGSACTITVQFAPTTADPYGGSVDITASNAAVTNSPVPLSGTGFEAPIASVTPAPLAFADVLTGSTATLDLTLNNTGNATLTGIAVAISGPDFSITGDTCTPSLLASTSCTITVQFAPTADGGYSGTVDITATNATVTNSPVSLSGAGISAAIASVSTGTLAFGDLAIGNTATQALTLSNTGNVDLAGISIGAFPAGFSQQGSTCTATLAAGGSCTITVQFSPTELLEYIGDLSITASNATVTNSPVVLRGTGVAAQGVVAFTSATGATLDGGTLAFGSLGSGNHDATVTLTVSGDPVTFGAVTVTGTRFSERPGTCQGNTVAAGSTCTVVVRFRGNGNAEREGSLIVNHDGTGNPQQLSLTGR